MITDRSAFLFRLQCTLFCVFYTALLFAGVVYFRHRLAFIDNGLGPGAEVPTVLAFARHMHHPIVLLFASLAPVALVALAWKTRPNGFLLFGQVALMLLLVLLVFLPPVATEITTSAILQIIHTGAVERGLIK